MAGVGDLFGRRGEVEQLFLWGIVNQVIQALSDPAFTALRQDVNAAHPVTALDPATAADLAARGLLGRGESQAEAARSGIDATRFAQLRQLRQVRLSPADLATAVLRSYVSEGDAQAQAAPQGVTPAMFAVLRDLAGDAIGPQQAAEALRRKLIPEHGRGIGAVSFDQAIAESRLHDKWGPILAELSKAVLSPADAASAVVRNFLTPAQGRDTAALTGVDQATFDTLVHLSGDAPGPIQLAEALRRGLIAEGGTGPGAVSFQQGIAEGRLADKWAPVIRGLARLWPTPTDALDATVKGQLTPAEGSALYAKLGGDPQFETWLLDSIGEGPSPLEAARLAARGIIPVTGTGPAVTSYEQAVHESRFRNKWATAYRALSEHIPAPSTIVTMLAHRALTTQQANALLLQNDMAPDLAAAYVAEAEYEAISDYRGLTQAAVTDMYYGHLINRDQAKQILGDLHVTRQAADLLLSYVDLRQVIDSIQRSVQRIAALYTGRKISAQTATQALAKLEIPATTVDQIIQTWELQAQADVKTLTATQIVDAWYYTIIEQDEAVADLTAIGYTPYDAWTLLSLKAKGPIPGQPPKIKAAPPPAVIPGVT